MWAASIVCLSVFSFNNINAAPVVHVWNDQPVWPLKKLALIPNKEFTHENFDPPLNVRPDGAMFLQVALVDGEAWINLALNSFVSFAKFQNVTGLTIMTTGDNRVATVFKRLGIFTYDAVDTIGKYPEDFRLDHPLPSWSWGAIIFLRFNAWYEAFRRGIGFCLIDTDVTFNSDVFFVRDKNGQFVDIALQGEYFKIDPTAGTTCGFKYEERFSNQPGYYLNPGLSCHAYNEKTFKFMQEFEPDIARSIREKLAGWGQPAYLNHFCEDHFVYDFPNNTDKWAWSGTLTRSNISVAMFKAVAPAQSIPPADRAHVKAYHAKACHGKNMGDALARAKCKEDWLRGHNQWFLPDNLPHGLDAWMNVSDATVAKLRELLRT